MSNHNKKPVALAAALIGGLALSTSAFAMSELSAGYLLSAHEGHSEKAGEGKCGGKGHSLAAMDTNKDGSISRAEFAAAHGGDSSRFAKYDANNDGSISAAELKAAHEGKCGAGKKAAGAKANMEGKCGEGKCGGSA